MEKMDKMASFKTNITVHLSLLLLLIIIIIIIINFRFYLSIRTISNIYIKLYCVVYKLKTKYMSTIENYLQL